MSEDPHMGWQRRCALYVREQGYYPHAEHVGRGPFASKHIGDLLNIGDRIIECTTSPLSELSRKLDQAEADAMRQEFDEFFVWKIAARQGIRRSYMITRAAVLWPLLARLDKLDAAEAEVSAGESIAWEHGYREGLKAAAKGETTLTEWTEARS